MPDLYDFLRYYIPGALFLLYCVVYFLIVLPWTLTILFNDFTGGFTAIIALFGLSPVIGYIIYTIYDTYEYNNLAMDWKNRFTLKWINEKMQEESETNAGKISNKEENKKSITLKHTSYVARTKMLIDYVLYTHLEEKYQLKTHKEILSTLRGFWSHHNARIVCGKYVPVGAFGFSISLVLISFTLININVGYNPYIQSLEAIALFFSIIYWPAIFLLSSHIYRSAPRVRKEAFALEWYLFGLNQAARELAFLFWKNEQNWD